MAYLTILFVLVAAIGGTLSYKANAALPGDVMYPYKIEVNEQLERTLSRTETAKAHWDLYTLQERLDEAKTLAKEGHLTVQAQTEVTQNITMHVKNLTAAADAFDSSGQYQNAADTILSLYTILNTETQKVADMSSQGSSNMQLSLAPVLVKLRTTLNTVTILSTRVQAKAANFADTSASSKLSISAGENLGAHTPKK